MKSLLINPKKKGIDKLFLDNINKPLLQKNEVLVKIKAVPLSAWEKEIVKNDDQGKLIKKFNKNTVNLGLEFSGIVQSDGKLYKTGDYVIGSVHLLKDEKAFSEYIAVNENYLFHLPSNLTFAEGATLPIGAETAYTSFTQLSVINNKSKILIVGANGGVGVYAVQFGHLYGAEVTTLGSFSSAEKLKVLGANSSYYYKDVSPFDFKEKFDVIFDLSKTLSFKKVKNLLNDKGVFINSNPQLDIGGFLLSKLSAKKYPFLFVSHSSYKNLKKIVTLVEQQKILPIVEKTYHISEFKKAFSDLLNNERFGRIVILF